nr:unnamed protein product [Callosobruchus analis]
MAKLSIYKNAVGLCWLLKKDPRIMDELIDVELLVFSVEYLKADDKEAYLLNKLISMILVSRLETSLKMTCESYTLDGIKAIQWGKQHEAKGVKVLERENLKVQQMGIWLHTCGYLGGSPDELVGDDGIVEVKCPFKINL